MGIVTSQIEMLHVNIQELGTDVYVNGKGTHSNVSKLRNNILLLKLCMDEHQQIMEFVLSK